MQNSALNFWYLIPKLNISHLKIYYAKLIFKILIFQHNHASAIAESETFEN